MAGFVPVGSTPVGSVPAGAGVIYSPDPAALVTLGYAPTVSAVEAASHRYWRILCRVPSGSGSFFGLSEVELRETPGGADVTGSGTASASSTQAGAPAQAFDNNTTTTMWQADYTSPNSEWLKYDFGAGTKKDITEVVLYPDKDGVQRTPGEFDIQWSDDDVAWTTAWSGTNLTWSVGTGVVFTKPSATGAARHWRVRMTSAHDAASPFGVREIQMRTAAGGADQTGSGTASARTEFDGTLTAANAFDNNNATAYASGGSAGSFWVAYDFGSGNDKDVVEVTLLGRSGTLFRQMPTSGYVEASADGLSWIARWSFTGRASAVDYDLELTRPDQIIYPPAGAHRFWAFRPTANGGGGLVQLAELAFLPTAGGADQTGSGFAISTAPQSGAVATAFDNTSATPDYGTNFTDKIAYDFGVASTVTRVDAILLTGSVINATYTPTEGDMLWSDDNETWVLVSHLTAPGGWTLGGTQEVANPTGYPKIIMF